LRCQRRVDVKTKSRHQQRSRITGDATRPSPTPLARIAVISLSALIPPEHQQRCRNIAIGSESSYIRHQQQHEPPHDAQPHLRFTSISLSCFSIAASISTNVNTLSVKNKVTSVCRVDYFARIFISRRYKYQVCPAAQTLPRSLSAGTSKLLADEIAAYKKSTALLAR